MATGVVGILKIHKLFCIYDNERGLQIPPIDQISLLVHEIAHGVQQAWLNEGGKAKAIERLARFGWDGDGDFVSKSQTFLGWDITQWDQWAEEQGDGALSHGYNNYFITGSYAMNNAWEWHAEQITGLYLSRVHALVKESCSPTSAEQVSTLWSDYMRDQWGFRFQKRRK